MDTINIEVTKNDLNFMTTALQKYMKKYNLSVLLFKELINEIAICDLLLESEKDKTNLCLNEKNLALIFVSIENLFFQGSDIFLLIKDELF